VKRIIEALKRFVKYWHDSRAGTQAYVNLLKQKIDEVDAIAAGYAAKKDAADVVYTSVRSYNSPEGDKVFWPWVRSVMLCDEYRFLIFSLRESVIREMAQASDAVKLHEMSGRLQMLQAIDNYLIQGLRAYDAAAKQD
jgi:hypothetical protein